MQAPYKSDETSIRIYRKDRERLGLYGTYHEPMKKILKKILDDYEDVKAKQLFEMRHGESKENF